MGLAYPFLDVVIVFFILLVVARMSSDGRLALWWLLGGLLATALADSIYAYVTVVSGYEGGSLLDSGWVAGYLAIAVGAVCSDSRGSVTRTAKPASGLAPILAGFLPMLAALSVVAIQIQLGQHPDRAALLMAGAPVVIALLRQAVLAVEFIGPRGERKGGSVARLYAVLIGATLEDRAEPAAPPSPNGTPR